MADRRGEAARMLPANGVRLDMLETIASLFVLVLALGGCMSAGEKDPVDTSRFASADAVHITGNDIADTEKDTRDIVGPEKIRALYVLVSSASGKWHRRPFDAPLLCWIVEFRRDGKSLGEYGVGVNYLEVGRYVAPLELQERKAAERLLALGRRE